jgi:hypothetical protein
VQALAAFAPSAALARDVVRYDQLGREIRMPKKTIARSSISGQFVRKNYVDDTNEQPNFSASEEAVDKQSFWRV